MLTEQQPGQRTKTNSDVWRLRRCRIPLHVGYSGESPYYDTQLGGPCSPYKKQPLPSWHPSWLPQQLQTKTATTKSQTDNRPFQTFSLFGSSLCSPSSGSHSCVEEGAGPRPPHHCTVRPIRGVTVESVITESLHKYPPKKNLWVSHWCLSTKADKESDMKEVMLLKQAQIGETLKSKHRVRTGNDYEGGTPGKPVRTANRHAALHVM